MLFSLTQFAVIKFCAQECERQQSGEVSVYNMLQAYDLAYGWNNDLGRSPDETYLMMLAHSIEPVKNGFTFGSDNNYRLVPVGFANGNQGEAVKLLPRLMQQLFTVGADMMRDEPELWVKELLRIHPFVDGNGRCAAILWNWLNGTLSDPVPYPQQEW